MRLSDLSDLRAGRIPDLAIGEIPDVARASAIQEGDLIVAARGNATDVCLATELVVGAFISLDLYLVRPNPSHIDSQYRLLLFHDAARRPHGRRPGSYAV
jgi:hypothetical protein